MDCSEIQAKATIAAALIAVHAVEIPTLPKTGSDRGDIANARLRELTESVYRAIVGSDASPQT